MSKLPFVCLNVEPESEIDEEFDNTAEIQLEEALKLYQNALKVHAQGPSAYGAAQVAYDELFKSEIFSYPDELSFSRRQALLEAESLPDDESTDDDRSSDGAELARSFGQTSGDGLPSTLPQVLYLSFKNYAQFQLDTISHDLSESNLDGKCIDDIEGSVRLEILQRVRKCLESFCDAIDKDDSDPEVWRQMSRLAALLGSPRLTRYCLEAALLANGEELPGFTDGLQKSIALEDLEALRNRLQGSQDVGCKSNKSHTKLQISDEIRRILEPCPGLPTPSGSKKDHVPTERLLMMISIKDQTWHALGTAILERCQSDTAIPRTFETMGTGYRIETMSDNVSKGEQKGGRKRKNTESLEARRVSTSRPILEENDISGVEEALSPVQTRTGDEPSSPSSERRLPMRTLSIESSKAEGVSQASKNDADNKSERRASLKRSPDAAGLPQEPPEARSRSKRLRARETGADEESVSRDLRQQIEKQMKPLVDADRHLFSVCDTLLSRMGVDDFDNFEALKDVTVESSSCSEGGSLLQSFSDFKKSLKTWNSNKSSLLNQGTGTGATATLITKGNEAGLASFMEHAKTGQKKHQDQPPQLVNEDVDIFISFVNSEWLNINDLAFAWITNIIRPRDGTHPGTQAKSSMFLDFKWNQAFKEVFHNVISNQDSYVFESFSDAILTWQPESQCDNDGTKAELSTLVELIQTIFEIHLDMFNSMIKPTSKVDQPTRTLQRARLQRWTMLSSQAIARLNSTFGDDVLDTVSLRHLFSMILYMSLDESSIREQIISGLHEVKNILKRLQKDAVILPNIDVMPEISIDAVDQEMSRLTTTDFFMSVFNPRDDDPLTTIESLEPILMPAGNEKTGEQPDSPSAQLFTGEPIMLPMTGEVSQKDQLLDFLQKSTASLQLSLWNRLSIAYTAIEFPPMVFVCALRSMDIILSELRAPAYLTQPEDTRSANLLVWTRNLIDLVDKCISLTVSEPTALDGMDEINLKLALETVGQCVKMFHLFALWDDSIRLGQTIPPTQQSGGVNAYKQAMALLRDMQTKSWRLLYILLKDSARQYADLFPEADDDFLALLAAIHSAIGLREYCKLNKKSFLKFIKPEILALEPSDLNEWRYQMAQLVYDLYDIRVLADSNTWMTLQEHNCPADQLDRSTARDILPMVMAQINGMKLKDLTKPDRREFKQAIDEIQDLVGTPKANSSSQLFNRRQLNAFQKTPLRKEDLERCLRGDGGFTNKPIHNDYTSIAKTGWFFVVGYLRLASFRSVRRQGPDSTKELDEAATFLKVDIDYDCDKWETWYRLGQVYDSMLDEEVAWTSDRINNKMDELIGIQRQAIHCYQMATALSVKHASNPTVLHDTGFEEIAGTISELYSDFGMRLYAASRPPFDMQAFSVKDHGRWYYTPMGHKFRAQPFVPARDAQVWLVASVLFRQALIDKPSDWLNWYMLGKCLWKLLHHPDAGGVSKEGVLEAFAKACETAPAKDPRRDGSPTLEPHQKLVSVVHKLVHSRGLKDAMDPEAGPYFMSPEEGHRYLTRSSYAKKTDFEEPYSPHEWLAYVRSVIKNLRAADKTNWHHRIVARAAELAYNDDSEKSPAKAAMVQLDTIVTKNMALTVWRPAFERVGRHFVYTTRYIKLIIDLLRETGDRAKLELLGKRVRKKQAEFIDHPRIWSKICKTHIHLLRSQTKVPEMHEEKVLSVLPFEKFVYNAALLQAWAQPAKVEPPNHPLLPVLRELFDLKKLNLNLIPNQGIDDLIGDTYAKLYAERVPDLVNDATNEKNREAMRVDRILMADTDIEEKAETSGAEAIPLTNPSGRAKIVGRMEVRRRAEALVQRLPTSQSAAGIQSATFAGAGGNETADEGDEQANAESPDGNNDADDESELSELEDEVGGDDNRQDDQNGQEEEEGDGEEVAIERDIVQMENEMVNDEESTAPSSKDELSGDRKPST